MSTPRVLKNQEDFPASDAENLNLSPPLNRSWPGAS